MAHDKSGKYVAYSITTSNKGCGIVRIINRESTDRYEYLLYLIRFGNGILVGLDLIVDFLFNCPFGPVMEFLMLGSVFEFLSAE